MKAAILTICVLFSLGCAKHPENMTQVELESACFDSVKAGKWENADKFCAELVMVDDSHYGGWGQLCLAEYHLGKIIDARYCCLYAINRGSKDNRVIHALSEIEFMIRMEKLKEEEY